MAPTPGRAFDSGSDGSYGALNVTTIGTNWVTMPPDGIFRCTTIYVATNCTVKFVTNGLNTPVYLLSQSSIVINGVIDVSGSDGVTNGATPTIPGPGGFGGGAAGFSGILSGNGQGPGGGGHNNSLAGPPGYGGSFGSVAQNGPSIYGNLLLVPAIGGSGGAGMVTATLSAGASGGAGGGAILLASSTSITNNGKIIASGGRGIWIYSVGNYYSGGGSGGAVRIVAPIVAGSGSINVAGGTNTTYPGNYYGGNGRVRVDSTTTASVNVVGNAYGSPVLSYGRSMFAFPPALPQLYFANVAGNDISSGNSTNVVLAASSSTSQLVTLCGTNFLGTVPVQIVATPANGSPFTTNIVLNFPAPNIGVTTNVIINLPVGTPVQLNAYANYGVQP